MKKSLFIILSLLTISAHAFERFIDDEIERLKRISVTSSRFADLDAPRSCRKRYEQIFNKRKIRIVYGFGYGDAGDVVLDHYSFQALRSRLLRPCHPDIYMCGFGVDKRDPNLLRKSDMDATGENSHLYEIKLIKGSISGKNSFNTASENIERQNRTCQNATREFMTEVANGADFVIYNGHSRDGGGPDFCPPVRTQSNHTNYPWYRKNKPGLTQLLDAMKTAKNFGTPNSIIGMFSCSSQKHFIHQFAAINKTAGYMVTSRSATFEEIMKDSYAALDSLLAQRCLDGFNQAFNERGATLWRNMFTSEF